MGNMFDEEEPLDGSLLTICVLLDLDLVDLTPLRSGRRREGEGKKGKESKR